MQMLLGSLASPASVLLMGVDLAEPSGTSFVFDPDEEWQPAEPTGVHLAH